MIVLQWCVVTWLLIAITKNRNCHQQMGMTVFLKSIVYFWCDRKNIGFLKKQKTSFTLLRLFLIKNWTFYWQQQQQQNSNINNSKSKEWRLQKATFNDRFPMPGRALQKLIHVTSTKWKLINVTSMKLFSNDTWKTISVPDMIFQRKNRNFCSKTKVLDSTFSTTTTANYLQLK